MIENTHAKKAFFFPHRVTNTRGNLLKQQRCQQSVPSGSILFVCFTFLFFFVFMDDVIVSLQTFFGGVCYGDRYKQHDRFTPVFLFLFYFLSRPSESSELKGPRHSPDPPDLCPMSVQSAVELQGGRGLYSLSSLSL